MRRNRYLGLIAAVTVAGSIASAPGIASDETPCRFSDCQRAAQLYCEVELEGGGDGVIRRCVAKHTLDCVKGSETSSVDPLQGVWEKKTIGGLAVITFIFGDSGLFVVETEVALGSPNVSSGTWKRSGQEIAIHIQEASGHSSLEAGDKVALEILSIERNILVLNDGNETFTLKREAAGDE